eukprot:gene9231-9396_t
MATQLNDEQTQDEVPLRQPAQVSAEGVSIVPGSLAAKIHRDLTDPDSACPDDPDGSLVLKISAFFGDYCAPPKTEDGTDTEELDYEMELVYVQIQPVSNDFSSGSKFTSTSTDKVADGSDESDDSSGHEAGPLADAGWHSLCKTLSHRTTQSRSLKEVMLGEDIVALLQTAGLSAGQATRGTATYMRSPFARQDSQAAAVAAGALDSQLTAYTAEVKTDAPGAGDAAAVHAADDDNSQMALAQSPAMQFEQAVDPPTTVTTPAYSVPDPDAVEGDVVSAASTEDLPVQAVLDELEELLAHCPPRHQHTRTRPGTPSSLLDSSNSPAYAAVSTCHGTAAEGLQDGPWLHSSQAYHDPQLPDLPASSDNANDRRLAGSSTASQDCSFGIQAVEVRTGCH